MEQKENNRRCSRTIRASKKKHLSFNQIVKFDNEYQIPKEIIWSIEEDLDKGIFELSNLYNIPVKLNYDEEDFEKLPPNVLTNREYFSSAGNSHNLLITNEKSPRIFYYYPNGSKKEYFNECINKIKGPNGNFICEFCRTSHVTKEALLNHQTTKKHLEIVNNLANNKYEFAYDSLEKFCQPNIDKYIELTVRVNKDNYFSKSEYKKKYSPGCSHCILHSSTALTKGYGNKSSKKTKGRNKRGKELI